MQISITTIIIILTVIASYYAWNKPAIMYKWLFNPYYIHQHKAYHRFITSGFIHKDGWHLFFNMIALYFFGEKVEYIFSMFFGDLGGLLFIALYILGIIISDIPSYIKHRNAEYFNSLGASGGVAAVVFSSILFDPLSAICLYFAICVPGFILGAFFLIYSWYRGKQSADNINHDAHLYGALFGVIFTIILKPQVLPLFFQKLATFSLF